MARNSFRIPRQTRSGDDSVAMAKTVGVVMTLLGARCPAKARSVHTRAVDLVTVRSQTQDGSASPQLTTTR